MDILTVFTPTYNRAYILPRCYNSLCNQTSKDFVWLIIDDGSSDDTKSLIDGWIAENKIRIKYLYQENQGKQKAVNTGILNCDTPYFAFLDSDDYFKEYTVERILSIFSKIKDNPKVAGILARKGTQDDKVIGDQELPHKEFIENVDALVRKYKFDAETFRAYKTEVLKQHLYPNISDTFMLESVMLSSIDRKYDLYIYNEVVTICEYLPDGYTYDSKRLYKNNPFGYALGINQLTIARRGFLRRLKAVVVYTTWCWKFQISHSFRNCKNKPLYLCYLPISIICYIFKKPKWIYS